LTYKRLDINGLELAVGQLCLVSTSTDLRIAYLSELAADPPADLKEPNLRRWIMDPPTRFTYIRSYENKTSALITWTDQHVLVLDPYFSSMPYDGLLWRTLSSLNEPMLLGRQSGFIKLLPIKARSLTIEAKQRTAALWYWVQLQNLAHVVGLKLRNTAPTEL